MNPPCVLLTSIDKEIKCHVPTLTLMMPAFTNSFIPTQTKVDHRATMISNQLVKAIQGFIMIT